MGPLPCRQNVLPEVWAVDRVADGPGRPLGSFVGECGVLMEIRLRLLQRGGPEEKEPFNVPASNVGLQRVHVDAEVNEVRDEHSSVSRTIGGRLQDIQSLQDYDVWLVN